MVKVKGGDDEPMVLGTSRTPWGWGQENVHEHRQIFYCTPQDSGG